jgi:hypothetical protein
LLAAIATDQEINSRSVALLLLRIAIAPAHDE